MLSAEIVPINTKLMDVYKALRFGGWAGYSSSQALDMARRVIAAHKSKLRVVWEYETDPDLSWMTHRERHAFASGDVVVIRGYALDQANNIVAVIKRVVLGYDPGSEMYRQQLEAELYLEAVACLELKGRV